MEAAEGIRRRVSAYALATDASGGERRILLARLSDASPVFAPGLWHLPGGGIDPGEQPGDALTRELEEETGLKPRDARLVAARSYSAQRLGVAWHLVALFYEVDLVPGRPLVAEADGSTAEVAWLPVSELRECELSPAAADGLRMIGG